MNVNGSLNIASWNSAYEKLTDLLDLRIFGFVMGIDKFNIERFFDKGHNYY